MGIGFTELILIFLVVLLVFGAKRLPEIAGAMGKAVNEFKKSKDEIFSPPSKVEKQGDDSPSDDNTSNSL